MLAGGQGSLTEPTGVSQNRGTRGQAGRGSAGVKRSDQGWTGPPSRLGWASGPTAPPLAGRQQGRSLLPGPLRSLSGDPAIVKAAKGHAAPFSAQCLRLPPPPPGTRSAFKGSSSFARPTQARGPPRGEAHPGGFHLHLREPRAQVSRIKADAGDRAHFRNPARHGHSRRTPNPPL